MLVQRQKRLAIICLIWRVLFEQLVLLIFFNIPPVMMQGHFQYMYSKESANTLLLDMFILMINHSYSLLIRWWNEEPCLVCPFLCQFFETFSWSFINLCRILSSIKIWRRISRLVDCCLVIIVGRCHCRCCVLWKFVSDSIVNKIFFRPTTRDCPLSHEQLNGRAR